MCDALGVAQVGCRVIDDQVVGVDRLAYRTVAQRAEIDLLKGRAAKPKHQQHAVGVWVVFRRRGCEIMVQVALKRVCHQILFQDGVVIVIADFDRAIRGQQFGAGVGLEAKHGLQKQRVAHPAHALNRGSVHSATLIRDLNLETKQL